jgi:hypothetical protein
LPVCARDFWAVCNIPVAITFKHSGEFVVHRCLSPIYDTAGGGPLSNRAKDLTSAADEADG